MRVVHSALIGTEALIGNGATMLDGAKVGSHALVAAGATVPPGIEIPDGMQAAGVPARVTGELSAGDWRSPRPGGMIVSHLSRGDAAIVTRS